MTPDRPEHTPEDEETENGVLSDTGSLDTTGIGILGGATAQVSVDLPAESEDDDLDDDVVGDEVPFGAEFDAAEFEAAPFEAEGIAVQTEFAESETEAAVVETEEFDATETIEGEIVAPADETHPWVTEHEAYLQEARDLDAYRVVVDEPETVEDAVVVEPSEIEHEPEGAAVDENDQTDKPAADAAPTAPASDYLHTPATGANPLSRRAAFHGDEPARLTKPAGAIDRVQPTTDISLTSKRLGEFDAGRESADLLTPDRLLDPHQVVKPEPEGTWQHLVYSLTGHLVNLGDSKRARARKELDRRIAAPLIGGARFVPVMSRKGGVGKTTVTTLLGMALADARDDRIIAVDANPDRGTLAERIARHSGKTVRDLVRARGEVHGYNDLSNIVARDETRLDVLASDSDPRVSEAFSDADYEDVASLAAHYYSIVLTDTGTGIVHSVMGATLARADQLVVVSGLSVDEARLASETLTWLETNGYSEQVRNAVVVLNSARPGQPIVRQDELETHFATRVRAVVRVPYDPHIAAGSAISFRDLQPATRQAARELAATVVEGLRTLATAA